MGGTQRLARMVGKTKAIELMVEGGLFDFVKARAVVGLPDAAKHTVGAVADFSGRPLEVFDDPGEALEWLVEQRAL